MCICMSECIIRSLLKSYKSKPAGEHYMLAYLPLILTLFIFRLDSNLMKGNDIVYVCASLCCHDSRAHTLVSV